MKKLFLLLLLIINVSLQTVNSQTQFQRTIGGTINDDAFSIIQTTDGGFAVAGSTNSFGAGNRDVYIVKLDGSGTLQWSRTVGGAGFDIALSIIQTTDGGYAVAGRTWSFGAGNSDFYIVKLDGIGTLQWTKTVGGTGDDEAHSIIQTTDGGYAIAGRTNSYGAGGADFYIVKLNSSGTLQWTRAVGGTDGDIAYSIIQTTDGGFAAAGVTQSFGAWGWDCYIVKLDGSGTHQWSRIVGETDGDDARSIIQTSDGGFAVAGYATSIGAGSRDFYILKLDGSGTPQWGRTVGGTDYDEALSIIQTTDGGFAAAGSTNSFGAGGTNFYIVKFDNNGTLQWTRTVGGSGSDNARSIIQTTDGGFAAAGVTESFGSGGEDIYIVKFEGSGNICGNSTSPSSPSGSGGTTTSATPTVTSPASSVFSQSSLTGTGGILTTICVIGIQPISNEIPASYELYQNYPNPFNPVTKIKFNISLNVKHQTLNVKLVIYDILGHEVAMLVNEQLRPGTYEVDFDGSGFSSGVYYYRLEAGDFAGTKKMVLAK